MTLQPSSQSALSPAPSGSSAEPPPAAPNGAPEGCWFDEAEAQTACGFFPDYLRHTEGEWAGKPFRLNGWQRELVRTIFGWKKADGTRLIRIVYLEVPRKNGKTEFAAGLALLLLLCDGEKGGQGYAMAADKDQARIAFNKAHTMAGLSPTLENDITRLKTSLFCPELLASFLPISSSPNTKHGFSPSFAIADEIHAWPDGELADVVHKGTAARRQPLEIYITTAGIKGRGFGWEMHDRAVKIRDGLLVDPSFLGVIFAADDGDDWRAEATWVKANPNIGISPKWDYLRAEAARATENPRLENEFKRYHLNLWTEQVTRWLDIELWDACAGEVPWQELAEALKGRPCFAGIDLSSKIDLSALVYAFPPEQEDGLWHVVPRLYLPEARLELGEKRDRLPYGRWAREGVIRATPGNVIDYGYIKAQLREDARLFRIEEAAFDPWNATQFAVDMQNEGMIMVEFRQGFSSMSEPSKFLEALVIDGRLRHGGHPALREMAKAVSTASDPAGNIKADKSKTTLRIDGIVAAIMAIGRAIVATPDVTVTGADIMVVV
jgi:phage terminase large subunit-like protein